MIARLRMPRLPRFQPAARRPARVRCEADAWTFDPRYTNGKCPICGWQPERAASVPRWLALVNRADWEMIGLFALLDVLFFLGLLVAHAAGLITGHPTIGAPTSHPAGAAASGPRLH